jgi:hypothetical protein
MSYYLPLVAGEEEPQEVVPSHFARCGMPQKTRMWAAAAVWNLHHLHLRIVWTVLVFVSFAAFHLVSFL